MDNSWGAADWDQIRLFVAVADAGSFNKAGEGLNLGHNTLRRAIQRLEDTLKFPLFYRNVGASGGVRLTPEGRRMIVAAREAEASITSVWRVAQQAADTMAGPIRLAITEGLGAFWLMPQLIPYLHDQSGARRVELQCAMRSVDVLRLEADISVQLEEPKNPDLIVRRLGYLHLIPWASSAYLERFGRPETFAELIDHRIVEQETDQLQGYKLDELFGPGSAEKMVLLKTNFSSAHYWALLNGGGIGLMPNYARMIGGLVEPVDLNFTFGTGIWMATHPEVLKSARHRKFADWLVECFSPKRFPWFGENYVSPDEIERTFKKSGIANYFSGFVARSSAVSGAALGLDWSVLQRIAG